METEEIKACRICGSRNLQTVFSLEDQYVATLFLEKKEDIHKYKKYALELVMCEPNTNNGCGFVQLRHTVSRDILFENYWYRSGINKTMRDALYDVVVKSYNYTNLNEGDIVCDIGSNDGTLLSFYSDKHIRIGIDPAKNMAEYARQHGDEIIADYFSSDSFFNVSKKKAKIVTSIAMFYSVVDPVTFAKDVYEILHDDGVWVVQMASLPLMIKNNCYDNIVHEHIGYYTIQVMETFLNKLGLYIVDGKENDMNGGSIRLYIKKQPLKPSKRLNELKQAEINENYRSISTYRKFSECVTEQSDKFTDFLTNCTIENTSFYGASTKGNVILQHLKVNEGHSFGVAERNPKKYGYYTIGSNLPIISEEEMRKKEPLNVVVLPYHFRSEIVERESALLDKGSRLIFPLPEFKIYTK